MNLLRLTFLIVLAGAALVMTAPHAEASTGCVPTGDVCHGWAQVSTTTGGVASTRCFSYRTTNSAPTCATTTSPETTWELVAGNCITLYYFDTTTGAVPPAAPNKLTVSIKLDNTATNIVNLYANAGEPANSASKSFCATSTGAAGGSPRAGTYRIVLNPIKDDGTGGVGNYNINSDGVASVGAITTHDGGALRGQMLVTSVARSAYPADSLFAYGTAGNEQVTVTSTFTQPNGGSPTGVVGVFDAATHAIGSAGGSGSVSIGGATTLAQSVTIDPVTTPLAGSPYQPYFSVTGNSGLLGEAWTVFAASGQGTNIVLYSSVVVYDSTTFAINPGIKLDSDGTHTYAGADDMWLNKLTNSGGATVTAYNRGEAAYTEGYILNARGEKLSRAMTVTTEDAGATTCTSLGSLTPTANKYSTTWTIPTAGSCTVAATLGGSPRYLRVTNTNQNHLGSQDFTVSSLLRFDQDGSGTPDNLVHECLTACPSTDLVIFNRGESLDCEGYLIDVRGTQYSNSAAVWVAKDSVATTTNSQTPSLSSGKYSCAAYTLSSSEKATADTTGDPHTYTATADGNTATTNSPDFAVSSLYFLDAHTEKSSTLVKDNFPTENSAEDTAYIISTAVTDTTHGWCHVVGVRKDIDIDTSGSVLTWSYIDPTSTTRFTGTTDTGSDGWTASHLDLLASTPLGTWTFRCTSAAFNGNTGTNDQIFTVSVPAGTGGFIGDPLHIEAAPRLAYASGTVVFAISAANSDGSGRAGIPTHIFFDLYNPSNTIIVTGGAVTEIGNGAYRTSWSVGASPALGAYIGVIRTDDAAVVSAVVAFRVDSTPTTALTISDLNAAVSSVNSHVDSQLATERTTINGHVDSQLATERTTINAHGDATAATNLATVLAELEDNENNQDLLLNSTAAQILSAIHNVNVTITGNFTIDNAALQNITANLQELHLDVHELPNQTALSLDNSTMHLDFSGSMTNPGLYWWFELIFWVVVFAYCFRQRNLFTLVFAIGGCLHLVNPNWVFGLDKSIPWMAVGAFLDFFTRHIGKPKEKRT